MNGSDQQNNSRADGPSRFFANCPLACQSLDFKGNIIEVNAAWLRLLGYESSAVIGRPFLDFLAPGYRRQHTGGLKLLQTGEAISGKIMKLVRHNGTEITIEADGTADFSEFGPDGRTYVVLRDITNIPRDIQEQSNLTRRHSLILNAAPGAIVGFDVDGMITFANPATETITGWPLQDLYSVDLHEHFHGVTPDGTPNPRSACDTCRALEQRESVRGETWFKRRDGSFFPADFHTQPYFVNGVYMGGVISFTDITERHEATCKLEQSEQQFRHLFQNAPVALWLEDFSAVWDFVNELKTNGVTDFDQHFRHHREDLEKCMQLVKIKAVNQATLAMHGARTASELVDNLKATMTKESAAVFRKEVVAMTKGAPGIEAITTLRALDGGKRPVMIKVFRDPGLERWSQAYVALTDLSEVRHIQNLNTRLVTAIEQSADSVVITDPEGVIQYCNPAFETISGYRRDETIGRTPRLLKSGHHDDLFYRDLWHEIKAGHAWSGHFVNRTKQDKIYEEEGTISPVFDNDGEIINFVAVKRDVTHQLALEKRLAQSQKMEAVGQLAGGIAHDFNNILHAMLGHLEFARSPDADLDEIRGEMDMLQSGAERAAHLTRQLLAFSRRQVLELENVDPNDLITNLLKMVRRVIGEDIQLDFRPGNINHQIHVDTGQIEQVLLNLCLNARDAMPEGGTLHLETDLTEVEADFVLAHPWAQAGSYIQIMVRDSGCGISPDVLHQIFEPFFTTKTTGRGTGLGLAMVYGIIKQHSGMILVDSSMGHGTTFTIYLPVVAPNLATEPAPKDAAAKAPGGTETILLAEDDESVREVAARILSRAGYRVLQAANGQEAMELFDAHPDEVDLALLDMVMPQAGGPEVARHIQSKQPAVRILFNTGYSEDAIRGRIPPSSQAPLLMKPHKPNKLLTCIRELLDDDAHS